MIQEYKEQINSFLNKAKNDKKYRLKILIICAVLLLPCLGAYWLIDVHDIGTYGTAIPIAMINGNSMSPALTNNELVLYYTPSKDPAPISVGNVIIYTKAGDGELVMHRIVAIESDGSMITQGDNNPGTDQAMGIDSRNVTMNHVIGIVAGPLELLASWIPSSSYPRGMLTPPLEAPGI